ncbi:MAG TPA: hypothetical protein VMW36_06985 [Patescibacteria group bacterium]|nr:hypothetical protein [Patescibacteria group bacterium]
MPWIELKKEYATRKEARQAAAQYATGRLAVKLVKISQKDKPLKVLATVRINR